MRTISWIHISDLHCGWNNEKGDVNWQYQQMTDKLLPDIRNLLKQESIEPNFLFFTGDVIWGAKDIPDPDGEIKKQYDTALNLFIDISKEFSIQNENIFIVPGNHDVNLDKILKTENTDSYTLPIANNVVSNPSKGDHHGFFYKFSEYGNFIRDNFGHQVLGAINKRQLETHTYEIVRTIEGKKIGIVGLNSAWSSKGKGESERTKLWMGLERQDSNSFKRNVSESTPFDLRIALLHHPIDFLHPDEKKTYYDRFKANYNFILHGHEHHASVDDNTDYSIIGSGACYYKEAVKNKTGYNIVKISLDEPTVELWVREYDNGAWKPHIITTVTDDNGHINLKNDLKPITRNPIVLDGNNAHKPLKNIFIKSELARKFFRSIENSNHYLLRIFGDARAYYSTREDLSSEWDKLYGDANKHIYLLGHRLLPAFGDKNIHCINSAIDRGVPIRVLLLNCYDKTLLNLIAVQTDSFSLKEQILDTLEQIKKIKLQWGAKCNLQVRLVDKIIYYGINIFDDLGLVTLYSGSKIIGKYSPSIQVDIKDKTQNPIDRDFKRNPLNDFYLKDFESYWSEAKHPYEAENKYHRDMAKNILRHPEQITTIDKWLNDPANYKLPFPKKIFIHLTSKCCNPGIGECSDRIYGNCICTNTLPGEKISHEIDYSLLTDKVIPEAIKNGINVFEFTGGGEPTIYSGFDQLLDFLSELKTQNTKLKFGLLTNGLFLTPRQIDKIKEKEIFKYIRFTYCHGVMENEELEFKFINSLKFFLKAYQNYKTQTVRIGLKCLLGRVKGEEDSSEKRLKIRLLNLREEIEKDSDGTFSRLNHIRIKRMRTHAEDFEPTDQQCENFKNDFYDYLWLKNKKIRWPRDIQIDLDDLYVDDDNFVCKLNPLFAVIAPNANLLICNNYSQYFDELSIGNLTKDSFVSLWGSKKHHEVINNIDIECVCNSKLGAPCRFIQYNKHYELYKESEKSRDYKRILKEEWL